MKIILVYMANCILLLNLSLFNNVLCVLHAYMCILINVVNV